jgi:predicted AAA+ superfamily ATPase
MRAACLRIGGLLNQTEMGRDVGISQPQVHRFLNLMEASYQAVRLPAFSVNRTSRLIKAPKLYWSDTGLAMYLSGETEPRGVHLENLILMDLLAWRDVQPRRVLPIEVKVSTRVSSSDAKGLTAFLEEYPALSEGALLLYAGRDTFALTRRVLAVPWWRVC